MKQCANPIKHYIGVKNVPTYLLHLIIMCILIALFLTLTGISKSFVISLVISQSFGISIGSIVLFLLWIFKPEKVVFYALIVIIAIASGTLIGQQIGSFVLQHLFSIALKRQEISFFPSMIICTTFGIAISYFFYSKARLKVSKDEIQQERIKRLSSEKETLEANLRLLQAQIEPHFLFNTLSNVLSLIDTNPTDGKSMLVDLIHYLRTSLSRTLPDQTTLDQEIDMIKAYLNIQKLRMGDRLHFRIELPDAVRQLPFPPMLLQPLVENAIKHGLEPKMEGGEIMIKVAEKDDFIRIEVTDTGSGFSSFHNTGVGIGNVRERIKLLYGEKGRLILEENKPDGVRATIEVPKRDVQSYHR